MRVRLSVGLAVAGVGWWVGVDTGRGISRSHSARVFWLHITSPLVAIACLIAAITLLAGSCRFQ